VRLSSGQAVTQDVVSQPNCPSPRAALRVWSARSAAPASRRVLLVAPQPFYEDRGTPIAVRHVVEGLSQLGYPVDLLTYPVGTNIEVPGMRLIRTANPFRFKSVPVGLSIKKILLDIPLAVELHARLRSGAYTCVHAVEEAAFPAVLLGRLYRVPVIYDMQSSLPEQLVTRVGLPITPIRHLLNQLEAWLLTRADLVVSSAGLAARVRRLAPSARVREWHYPSVMVPAQPADADQLRRRLGIPPDVPVVLYGGTFESYQGLPELIAAIPAIRAQVPTATFVLVGADRANGLVSHAGAESLIESGALRIVDRQPRANMAAYLALADVLVSPRAYGGNLPLKIFDYLAAGRPIVATDIPTHRTVLAEDRAVLVAPRTDALAQGILTILGDPDLGRRLAATGRRYAETHFGWTRFVDSLESLYAEVEQHANVAGR
jgi:glycosyltransferase involved in cell wall biosynthesis